MVVTIQCWRGPKKAQGQKCQRQSLNLEWKHAVIEANKVEDRAQIQRTRINQIQKTQAKELRDESKVLEGK